ncbi:MAG: hypothetical protein KC619_23380 [Myxococcales bacterium]|nr:hypothetical protein [Myxococcales bacterium]
MMGLTVADQDGGSFFRSVAKAMLERSLPSIRDWLAGRLGPGAKIGDVTLEGDRVFVRDAHVPVGAQLVLDVEEAILDARPEDMMAGLPPARLASLKGSIRAVDGQRRTTFTAPVEVDGKGAGSEAWVDGEVRVGGATWKAERGVGPALPMYGTGRVVITSDGWRVLDASLTSGLSQTHLDARGSLGGEGGAKILEAVFSTKYARLGHALDVLAAFRGEDLRLPFPLPLDAVVDGTASLDPSGSLQADLTGRTERSELALTLASKDGVLEDAALTGTLAPDELLPAWLDPLVDRAGSGAMTVEAKGKGRLDALDATVELEATSIASPWLRATPPGGAKLVLRGGRRWNVEVAIDGAGTGQAQIGVAPYGSLDGAARLELLPGAWVAGGLRASGKPVEIDVQVGGTRSAPELGLELSGQALAIERDGHRLATKRPRAKADVRVEKRKLVVDRASARARVGPGSAELSREGEVTRVGLARIDGADALAGLGLFVEQDWLGAATPQREGRFALPEGAQLWGELTLEAGALAGRAHVETARSRVSFVPLRYERGAFEGTEALATLDYDDAIAFGLFRGSPVLPVGPGRAEVHAKLTGRGAESALGAVVSARRVGWRIGEGAELLALEHGSVTLELSRAGLAVRDLSATLFGGRLEGAGGIFRDGERVVPRVETLTLRGARDGLRERLLGDRLDEGVLEDLSLDAELSGEPSALTGRATLSTARSRLEAVVGTHGAALTSDSQITGHVGPEDLSAFLGPVAIEGEPFGVQAGLGGTFARPTVALAIDGGQQRLRLQKIEAPLSGVKVRASADSDGVEIAEASAWLASGRVEARGVASRRFGGRLARLRVEGVRLDEIARVRDELGGALHVEAGLWQRDGHAPGGRVRARVEDPRYEGVARFAELFSRYGLRMPERASSQPLTAALSLIDGALELTAVSAGTPSFAVEGAARRSALGIWHGDAHVIARQTWLETSHLFERPARWIGDVRVPVHVDGPDGGVRVRADVLATLDALLAKTWIGRGLSRAIEALMRTLRFEAPSPPVTDPPKHHAVSALTSSDALVDRIATDAPEADAAIDALLERGFEPKDLAERVAHRRK